MRDFVFASAWLGCAAGLFVYAGRMLAKTHGADIRVVSLFFAFVLVATIVVGMTAIGTGAIGPDGRFQGVHGETIGTLLKIMTDLDADLAFVGAIAALVVAPQLIAYLIGGFFGCAVGPRWLGPTFGFLVWSVVKSLAAVAGVFFGCATLSLAHGWMQGGLVGSLPVVDVAFTTLAMSLFILLLFRQVPAFTKDVESLCPKVVSRAARRFHAFCTRNVPKSASCDHRQE